MSRRRRDAKKPKSEFKPALSKTPIAIAPVDYSNLRVQWSFQKFDNESWHDEQYTRTPFHEIADHLKSFESRTWKEIRHQSRKHDHPIEPAQIIARAQERLQVVTRGQYEELWRFRFTGACRIWGVRIQQIFYVLWWDPQHKIYPTDLRNT